MGQKKTQKIDLMLKRLGVLVEGLEIPPGV
jgi:hypothetical protein